MASNRAFKLDSNDISQLQNSFKDGNKISERPPVDVAKQQRQTTHFKKAHPTYSSQNSRRPRPFICNDKNMHRMSMPVASATSVSLQLQSAVHNTQIHTTDEIQSFSYAQPQIAKAVTITDTNSTTTSESPRKKSEIEFENYRNKAMERDFPEIEKLRCLYLAGKKYQYWNYKIHHLYFTF